MGVIPWRSGHSSARSNADCLLCAETRAPAVDLWSVVRHLRHIVPLVVGAIVGLVVLAVDRGPAGCLGGGVALGIFGCGLYVWSSRRDRGRAPAIAFNWGLHLDGLRARLELQTLAGAHSPTRIRVMDRDGQIVAVSSTAVVSLDGTLEFQVEPPLDLIADLDEEREIDYAIEARVEDEWKPVRLEGTGRRTAGVVDGHGRISRVPDVRDVSQTVDSAHLRRSTLN